MAGDFYRIRCPDCENEQVIFDRAVRTVDCAVCGQTLARPTGGKAAFEGEIVETVQRRSGEGDSVTDEAASSD